MKSPFAFTASALLLWTAHACGSILVSVGGPVLGDTGIDGLAEGWSMSSGHNVSVAAHFVNGNGPIPATGNTAYLTSGSLPSLAGAVTSTNFALPGNYDGMFILFPGVSLGGGSYWLILTSPGPPNSYAGWDASNPATITTVPGTQFLGFADSFDHGQTFQPLVNNGFAYQFTVSDVPEPSSLLLCFVGLAASGYFRHRLHPRPQCLIVGAMEEAVGHAGDVVANHAMDRAVFRQLAMMVRQAAGVFDEEME
jgi:hypothetical protein